MEVAPATGATAQGSVPPQQADVVALADQLESATISSAPGVFTDPVPDAAKTRVAASPPESMNERYARHSKMAEKCKAEYEQVYRQLVANLSPTQLEPFATILEQHENYMLQNPYELVAEMRAKLLKSMINALERFWHEYDVPNKLTQLEMLKEEFKGFEGKKWDISEKDVLERTLPTRMFFKQMQLRHWQKQLQLQNVELEAILKTNMQQRAFLQKISQKREYLKERMLNFSASSEERMQSMMEMALGLLDDEE